jgi:hypothetical protein
VGVGGIIGVVEFGLGVLGVVFVDGEEGHFEAAKGETQFGDV